MSSILPGTGVISSTPAAMTSRGISNATPTATAAAMFVTLIFPTTPQTASNSPTGVWIVSVVSNSASFTSETNTSACPSLEGCVAYVMMGTRSPPPAASMKYAALSKVSRSFFALTRASFEEYTSYISSLGSYGSSMLMTARCRAGSVSLWNSFAFASRYFSMLPWKSRWSRDRFVNTATSKSHSSTLPSSSACDDTSIAHAPAPASIIPASICCV
mmetsp:Transcript_11726/g.42268  ORF Transcript_11726/g.42268 Transcript_11726/m.42268 type:complete len:216 (+) Transcript_11726:759-1406(+)|eukprot:19313-Pelagococcus_subviridis.AAC.3